MRTPDMSYDLNRPVHLGRRDVLMEKAMELFPECLKAHPVKKRLAQIDAVLYFLHAALEPAIMAAKSARADPVENSVIMFLRLVFSYLNGARALMSHESQMDNTSSPLWKFLHREGKAKFTGFARSSEQLLQDVAHLFHMGEAPFRDLQKKANAALSPEELGRYQRAYADLKAHGPSAGDIQRAVQRRPNFLDNS